MLVYVRVSERQPNCHYALLIKLCLPVSVVVITTLLWFVSEPPLQGRGARGPRLRHSVLPPSASTWDTIGAATPPEVASPKAAAASGTENNGGGVNNLKTIEENAKNDAQNSAVN